MNDNTSPIPTSPVPQSKRDLLDFFDAIREVMGNKKVTRASWGNENTYLFIHEEFLYILMDNKVHPLIVSMGDMQGIDWYVIPEEGTHE